MAIDLNDALGPHTERLREHAERMIAAVHEAGASVVEVGVENGAPEVRYRFPEGSHPDAPGRLRRRLIAIQQEVP